jgi:hypothetical protein
MAFMLGTIRRYSTGPFNSTADWNESPILRPQAMLAGTHQPKLQLVAPELRA